MKKIPSDSKSGSQYINYSFGLTPEAVDFSDDVKFAHFSKVIAINSKNNG